MTQIHITILVSCIALLLTTSGTVATQETATASAPTEMMAAAALIAASESSNEMMYYGDAAGNRAVRIISVEYVDGTAVLVLESDLPRTITVTASAGSTSTGVAAGDLVYRPIPPGWTTTRIDSPGPRMTLTTSYSVENGRCTEIRFDDGGSALIADPFIGMDMRGVVIGGTLGASFGTLLITARRRFGLHRDMECIA